MAAIPWVSPCCTSPLALNERNFLCCTACDSTYPIAHSIAVLIRNSSQHLAVMERLIADNPAWNQSEQVIWYDHGPCRHHLRRRRAWVESALREHLGTGQRAAKLLDMGCGDGANLRWLGDYAEEVHGCDANLLRLRRCQAIARPDTRLCLADIHELPYEDDYFDVVFLNHVLEHVPDDVGALRSVRRVLKQDGLLILGVPNEGCWWWRLAYRLQPVALAQSDHVHFYTAALLVDRCREAGLEVQEIHHTGWGPPHFKMDEKLRQFRRVDGLFEWLGSRFLKSQASSLYVKLHSSSRPKKANAERGR